MKNVSVISGGAGGMGKAVAKELGQYSTIILGDYNQDHLSITKNELNDLGIETYTAFLDVRDRQSVAELAIISSSHGNVINVIHAAGVSPTNTPADQILKINAIGTINMVEAFFPVLSERGILINVSSIAAHMMTFTDDVTQMISSYAQTDFYDKLLAKTNEMAFGGDEFAIAGIAYSLSKFFVLQFTKMNVLRFAKKGCRILSISPGSYLTPMHQSLIDLQPDLAESQLDLIPFNRWGRPYEFAALVDFLCSSGAGFINGIDILADGGQLTNTLVDQI